MIIDIHGHYTTAPDQLTTRREAQIAGAGRPFDEPLTIADDEIRDTIQTDQLKVQKQRGTDVTLFSPRASAMGHHFGDENTSLQWTRVCNDLIYRVCSLFPRDFVGVCQLPQSPGVPPANSARELQRCVDELGFVACNPNFHATGAHYMNADTTSFMQFIQGDLFHDFPTLRFITDNILFASEMIGAVRGIDPETGHHFDDTKRYLDKIDWLSEEQRQKLFEGNALRVYPRLAKKLSSVSA